MWVLYFLSSAGKDLTQQDLIDRMMFPKQTVNSAVAKLAEQGPLTLTPILGTRNKKSLSLTEEGKKLAEDTVLRMLCELRNKHNNVLVVEHSHQMFSLAGHIIEMGPEGGSGGAVVFTGTPEQLLSSENSKTGRYLKAFLEVE